MTGDRYHLRGDEEGRSLCGANSPQRMAQSARMADCVECLRVRVAQLERRAEVCHRRNQNGTTRCGDDGSSTFETGEVTCSHCLRVLLNERTEQLQRRARSGGETGNRLKELKREIRRVLQEDDRR